MDALERVYQAVREAQASNPRSWDGDAVELEVGVGFTSDGFRFEIRDLVSGDRISRGEWFSLDQTLDRLAEIVTNPEDI